MSESPHPEEEAVKAEIANILKGVSPETARSALAKVQQRFDAESAGHVLEQLHNSPLSETQKQKLAKTLLDEASREIHQLEADLTNLSARKGKTEEGLERLVELQHWCESKPNCMLELNDCSRLHRLQQALSKGQLIDGAQDHFAP
jgi:hypothetical protein